ncbi:ABC transporter permease [Paraburkholderia domus]|jgi:Ribose/xylose/arabinose/galactoside ABC-type transport systems, permease components|uniref:ABC transporter permease n=1 Tax=Paraburkholderia domus TaxID=2793075 RepID=UPI001913F4B8|nr:ABC transporter permease [Paraburkholderia domus]MBK5065633.1 ABC transporter permease [Burkholderia sp. R-70199]CAE6824979.1 Ribose import permease protein RbsC [Paraburkholderia domus]CAE6961523.1 Ribose import permease protein RbsC [Paraburkholderia domus]
MAIAESLSNISSSERFSNNAYRRIELVQRYGILAIFLLLCVTAALSSPFFLTPENLLNVVRQVSVVGLTALGMTFVILTAGIDLSVGSILALTTLAVAGLKPYGPVASLAGGLAVALACGWLNGFITTKGRIQPFIVTLGMMTALVGVGLAYSDGQPVIGVPVSLGWIGRGRLGGVPVQAILFILMALASIVILKKTRYGRHIYAVGGNIEAARLSGVAVDRVRVIAYCLSGLFAGLGGIVMAAQLNIGEANLGKGLELDAIAAVVVGGTSLAGGAGGIGGTIIGVLLIGVLNNLLNLLNIPAYTQLIVKGAIIVIAVLIHAQLSRSRGR